MSGPDKPDSSGFEQNYLRESFESMPYPVLVIDVNTRKVVNINKRAAAQFGELKEGVTCYELTHNEANPCAGADHKCTIDEVLRTKKPVIVEHIHYKKCDEQVVIEVHAIPLFDANGEISHILEFSFDITKQSKAVGQLAESEGKYRFIAENTVDVIFTMDLKMQITYTTPNIAKIRGFTLEEINQQQIGDMLTEGSVVIAKETLEQIIKLDEEGDLDPDRIWTLKLDVKKKDGTTYPAEMTFSLIKDETGKLISLLGVSRNITERKKLQEQVGQMQKMDSIGQLAGGIAHDFNNLLTVISGHADLVIGDLKKGDPMIDDISEIQKAAKRAAILTRQILAYSRKQMLSPEVFNLNYTILDIYKFLGRLLGENISIEVAYQEGIWNIYADEDQIRKTIVNLATNARDAMSGGGKLKIETTNRFISEYDIINMHDATAGRHVCISITDEGSGMEQNELLKIFDPFYTTKDIGMGTGLGLSMAYGTIKQHGGWIDVDSKIDKGTTFEIYLPAINQKEEVDEDESLEFSVELFGQGKKILIVEDEDSVRDLLYRAMKRCGFDIKRAESISEARRIFEKEKGEFDIVLSDVLLPDKDVTGCDLALELQQQNPNLKVALISGYVDVKSRWPQIRESGFRFLNKPFQIGELIEFVRKVLNS